MCYRHRVQPSAEFHTANDFRHVQTSRQLCPAFAVNHDACSRPAATGSSSTLNTVAFTGLVQPLASQVKSSTQARQPRRRPHGLHGMHDHLSALSTQE